MKEAMKKLNNNITNKMKITSGSLCFALITATGVIFAPAFGQSSKLEPIKEKQTTLGLYVTAKEAYEMWKADTAKIEILDVRTFEEYIFIGHAPMAWNIPLAVQTHDWDSTKKQFAMKPNPDFVNQVKEKFKLSDTILVTCRSGGRSAMAVNALAAAGFKNIYNITDGVEGDVIKGPENVFAGQRLMNGWKNSGCPMTYEIDPSLMNVPQIQ